MNGCLRWRYNIKCNYCNKRNNYKNFIASNMRIYTVRAIKHKILFTPILNNLHI